VEAVKNAFLLRRQGTGRITYCTFHGFKAKIAHINEQVQDAKKNSPFRAPLSCFADRETEQNTLLLTAAWKNK
jgi:hypothetical protein